MLYDKRKYTGMIEYAREDYISDNDSTMETEDELPKVISISIAGIVLHVFPKNESESTISRSEHKWNGQ